MDEKTRELLKETARKLCDLIDKAERGSVEINLGHEDAVDIHSWFTETAPNGELTVFFKLYVPDMDKRAELFTKCVIRP